MFVGYVVMGIVLLPLSSPHFECVLLQTHHIAFMWAVLQDILSGCIPALRIRCLHMGFASVSRLCVWVFCSSGNCHCLGVRHCCMSALLMGAQQSFDHRLLTDCKNTLLIDCICVTDKCRLCFRVLQTWLSSQAWQLSLSSE